MILYQQIYKKLKIIYNLICSTIGARAVLAKQAPEPDLNIGLQRHRGPLMEKRMIS